MEVYCGEGTIFDTSQQKCVYFAKNGSEDLEKIFDDAMSQTQLLSTRTNIVYRTDEEPIYNIANRTEDVPYWYTHWVNNGRYDGDKLISGENFFGDGVNCSCGDCAGWRGGNAGTCAGYNVAGRETSSSRRVACDPTYTPDRCVCTYPYVPINGLCVTPFSMNTNKPCCSSCIYDSSCVGEEVCEGTCEEQRVTYPGIKLVCDNSFTPISETANTVRASTQELASKCVPDMDHANQNEYECALQCELSGPECSKRCLPHLWKWKEVWNDETNELVGYIETDDLIQFKDQTDEISFCPNTNRACRNTVSIPEGTLPSECKDCTDCYWELNPVLNQYEYVCENCAKCTYPENVYCETNTNCRGCYTNQDPTATVRNSIQCTACTVSDCTQTRTDQRQPDASFEVYNKGEGYKPEDVSIWENWYKFGELGSSVGCEIHGGTSTCDATFSNVNSPSKGMLDGGALGFTSISNIDCMARGSCSVKTQSDLGGEEICYGGLTYNQMNASEKCQALPLPPISSTDSVPISEIVPSGVARGVSRKTCQEAFCQRWKGDRWVPLSPSECEWLCQPENAEINVPELMTTAEQLAYFRTYTQDQTSAPLSP